jgi:phage shock protein C
MKKLVRLNRNRIIAGICGGLGEYFNIDATLIRILFVLLGLFSFGSMLLAYFIAMLVIPLDR